MTTEDLIPLLEQAGISQEVWFEHHRSIERFAALVAAAEREKVAAWMRSKSYATGHGDTVEDLLKELEWQVAEREREACAKVCEKMADNIYSNSHEDSQPMPHAVAKFCAAAIRARGET